MCGRRDVAAVDAAGGAMEPRAEEAATPAKARAQGALWRTGADGRELSSLAGGARARGLLDGFSRRRHEHHAGALGGGRDDLGGGWGAAVLGGALRGAPEAHVDWKNLYNRAANAQERLRGEEPLTQFG